ncbi:MAG: hypothetical protein IPO12_17365 [Flavobacteriales bacterium]|nr:hypothetical protein [Flavobacteriales bacterium]
MRCRTALSVLFLVLASAVPAQGHLRALITGPAPDMERYARDMDRSLIWMRQNDDSAYHLLREQLTKATMRRDTLRTAWMNYYLGGILMWRSDHPGALEHYAQARDLFRSMHVERGIARCNYGTGDVAVARADLTTAVTAMQGALREGERLRDTTLQVMALNKLGYIAGLQRDLDRSRAYYEQGVVLAEAVGWCSMHVNLLRSLGNAWKEDGHKMDKALAQFATAERALLECAQHDRFIMATLRVERALLVMESGRNAEAMATLEDVQQIFDSLGNATWSSFVLGVRASIHRTRGNLREADALAHRGYELARGKDLTKERIDNLLELHQIAAARGDYQRAYDFHREWQQLTDTLVSRQGINRMVSIELRYRQEKEQLADSLAFAADKAVQAKEIQKQKLMRNGFMGGFALVALFAGVFFLQRNRISKEKARSEELLLNILPEEVAEELKAKGYAEAVHIDQVTVLFTDFKGFTAMSEKLSPKELVKDLHECFSAFDDLSKHGIEKIKTIGDAYMAAGGLPTPNTTHALDVVRAAFEMRDFIAEGKARKISAGLPFFEIRIGVHTGPVVAGIVGVKKFSYDIWGDTVNIASRMESSGEVGQVNISESTYALVKKEPGLTFTSRGKVQAKGKGDMEMYFVHRSSSAG